MVLANNKTIQSSADLKGKVAAVKLGTATVEYVETLGAKKNYQVPQYRSSLLRSGHRWRRFRSSRHAQCPYYIETLGKGRVKVVGPSVKAAQYGIAFPRGSPLREKVNVALLEIMEDGSYADLYRKWFNSDPE